MVDSTDLKSLAKDAEEQARAIMAIALALEDDELSKDEAIKAIDLYHTDEKPALIQSDVYPGDEYFDQAVRELDGYA